MKDVEYQPPFSHNFIWLHGIEVTLWAWCHYTVMLATPCEAQGLGTATAA
ncbi:hypothetical protein TIFTF001_015504 [Ficus carica]|uniref:Uncharacterized protein n=1 Tax=Ficus carica TaxID=3494 RepID=A0AA88D907_FICCA|nr:hypothetical protein TIFTF001_015504 [Ficus carica]